MFIAALFTIAKLLETAKMPHYQQWIKKVWFLYTMEVYSATKKNEIFVICK
jgi:hypothetical protein